MRWECLSYWRRAGELPPDSEWAEMDIHRCRRALYGIANGSPDGRNDPERVVGAGPD